MGFELAGFRLQECPFSWYRASNGAYNLHAKSSEIPQKDLGTGMERLYCPNLCSLGFRVEPRF